MDQGETLVEKHTRLARRMLEQADDEIREGDLVQGSEKLWGAANHALKAVCASRGWRHSKYAQRYRAALSLAEESGYQNIAGAFDAAKTCHGNFYNDWLEVAELNRHRDRIRGMIESLLPT